MKSLRDRPAPEEWDGSGTSRRSFIRTAAANVLALTTISPLAKAMSPAKTAQGLISCTSYPWFTFYRREGREWMGDADACMRDYASSGLKGYEPSASSVQELEALAPLLVKYGIRMPSVYIGTTLHDPGTAGQNIEDAFRIAMAAKKLGAAMVVSNPSPIRWGVPEDKSDAALNVQAESLEKLGSLLAAQEMTLAYHNHDMELRQGAREFHHMLQATSPKAVSFCLDVHWIYRGMGNSNVGLFDVVKMYGSRIKALHIRQSRDQIWSEVFGSGDIDYARLVKELVKLKLRPNLVLEQCLEDGSPRTTTSAVAHKEGLEYALQVFEPLLK